MSTKTTKQLKRDGMHIELEKRAIDVVCGMEIEPKHAKLHVEHYGEAVLITVLLKELGVRRVICKALTERQKAVLLRIGADQVVLPEHEAGEHLAHQLSQPHVVDWLELGSDVNLTQLRLPESWAGRSLRQLDLTGRFGIVVVLIKGQRLRVAPRADEVLEIGDTLVLVGRDDSIAALENWDPAAG